MNKKKKMIYLTIAVFVIVLIAIGTTQALFIREERGNENVYITGLLQITVNNSTNTNIINLQNTVPKTDEEGLSSTPYILTVTNVGNVKYHFDLKLLSDTTYIQADNCSTKQLDTSLVKIKIGDDAPVLLSSLTNGKFATDLELAPGESKTIEIRSWLISTASNNAIGKHYHGKVVSEGYAVYTPQIFIDKSNANGPVLADGMIPVRYNAENMKWETADIFGTSVAETGYDYENKTWANAVMVVSGANNATRDYYKNAPVGTEILESDVLGYFVWIPRYRYQLFNVGSDEVSAQQISVEFQNTTDVVDTGTTNGAWLTHPAFWWDEDNDGVREAEEELPGIWVGKFETSTTESTCYSSSSTANCNNENQVPVIKPNRISLRRQIVSNQYTTARKINTTDYLDEINQIDAHMMKNMEWGAVAYLTQSQYGRCESGTCSETYINNSESYYTGRSGGNVGGSATITMNGTYSYDGYTCTDANCTSGARNETTKEAGYNASTNGNITGVYDMSGGAFEYVMGVQLNDGNGSINYNGSDFTTSTLPFLENTIGEKYVDYYTYGTSSSDYTRRKLGDATGEARGWYSDYQSFVNASHPWFRRGGDNSGGASTGVFASNFDNGAANSSYSFRVVLTPLG